MRSTEPVRLGLIGLLIILIQLSWYLKFPAWRDGFDLYLVFILLLAATRGSLLAGAFAVMGGLMMDAYSSSFPVFHVLYYMAPVAIGGLIRSQIIVEYRNIGALAVGLLILGKILAMFLIALAMGWVDSPMFLLRLNYWSLVLTVVTVFVSWRWFVKLIPPRSGVMSFGR